MNRLPSDFEGWTPELVARYEPPICDLEEDYEARLGTELGDLRLTLGLGGIPVEVRTDSRGIHDFLLGAFGAFAEAGEPRVRLSISAIPEELPFKTLRGTLKTWARGTRVVGKFREMAGYIDTRVGRGRGLVSGDNYRQDVGNYLRLVVSAMTPPLDAVLFHTSAIASRSQACLFFGPSTAGKSTLTRLSAPRHEILTDDMLVLRAEPQGKGVRAATCGFWGGETKEYPSKRLDLPVRAFFRLRKGEQNNLRPLSPADGARELVCGVPSIVRPVRDHQFILGLAEQAAASVPFFELTFHKKDDSFWSLVDDIQ